MEISLLVLWESGVLCLFTRGSYNNTRQRSGHGYELATSNHSTLFFLSFFDPLRVYVFVPPLDLL